MRRVQLSPVMDLIPMMGLCTVLIAMLLVAWMTPLAMIETSVPHF